MIQKKLWSMCYSHLPEFSNTQVYSIRRKFHDGNYVRIMDRTASAGAYIRTCTGTASSSNDGAVAVLVECDSRRAVGPTRGIYDTTKPSAAFGGTFSPSWVVLLCVITVFDLKPRHSLPSSLEEEAVPTTSAIHSRYGRIRRMHHDVRRRFTRRPSYYETFVAILAFTPRDFAATPCGHDP